MGNWFAAAAAGVLAMFGSSTADHKFPKPPRDNASSTISLNITCIAQAVAARESSLDTAMATHTQDINTAYTTRASALASAYAQTSNESIKKSVRTAWQQFGAALKLSKKNWQKAKETAWKTFKDSAKACGGNASAVSDAGNAGGEMNE